MSDSATKNEIFTDKSAILTLMDGHTLECPFKREQPAEVKSDALQLDTTGQYLSFSGRPRVAPDYDVDGAELRYGHRVFTENAWFLLENCEKIFSDSRMFLAPVKVQNGLAYTGTSGLRHPTLGVYLEWWKNYEEAAVDANDNLVWYISGSPLSGSNCCCSVDRGGRHVKIAQRTRFIDIWHSFMEVNNRYVEAKQRCEAYTLDEVLIKLRGEDYRNRLIDIRWACIMEVRQWDMNIFRRSYEKVSNRIRRMVKKVQWMLYAIHRQEIDEFYDELVIREHELFRLHQSGDPTYTAKCQQLSDFVIDFISMTFGYNGITLADIIRYAKDNQFFANRKLKA